MMHQMPFGAEVQPDGGVRFRLWGPSQDRVNLAIDGEREPLPMQPCSNGWHELTTGRARPGTRYCYVLENELRVPDPASRFQPVDVHGPSEVIDPDRYRWQETNWRGRAWPEAVLYELHIGTFTDPGTFRAAAERLDYLHELGVTALEIMPVADFPGRRNWGYDGVLPFAPDSAYGRPEDFKALVDAAHARGILVLLDVVYNHFGPEGNYLRAYAPQFFTARHKTPWGDAINFDGADSRPVREFVIHNALYWIEEYQLDGLRLDAVHTIRDDSPKQILCELAERVRAAAADRQVHLLLENDDNRATLLERNADGRPLWFTAQWNDDVHHVLHTAAAAESHGYYTDYFGNTERLGRALAEGFAFQGELMPYHGCPRGEPGAHLPPSAFVGFLQNHDQAGNRAFGERIGRLAGTQALRATAAVYLLLPQTPMLFMGEEWNASQPFLFFSDFSGGLGQAVREGRRREFARFPEFQDPALAARIPDPQSLETFQACKLRWPEAHSGDHAAWLDWYCRILRVRRERIAPLVPRIAHGGSYEIIGSEAVTVRWQVGADHTLHLAANLSDASVTGFPSPRGTLLWQEGEVGEASLAPWSARWSLA
jgi:malto-oligosyltrehalose trehalohydrolase